MTTPHPANADQLHLEIGRFVADFSRMCGILEYVALLLICKSGPVDLYERASILVSGLTAQPLANIVFSLLTQTRLGAWSHDDLSLLKQCRKELDDLIEERNRIAHDVWDSVPGYSPETNEQLWGRSRRQASPRKGKFSSESTITVSYLQEQSKHATRLMELIQHIAVTANSEFKIPLSNLVVIAQDGWLSLRSSG